MKVSFERGILMYYYYDTSYIVVMLISLIVSGYAHFKVQHAFNKYSKVPCSTGLSGEQAARRVLGYNKVQGISIERTRGHFTDYFDSRSSKICLSEDVYDKSTIASVSVAAHESGHATQNDQNYFPLRLRHALVPICQFGSNAAFPLVILGMIVNFSFLIALGVVLFFLAVFFQLVTLPVEFDASRRALETIKADHLLNDDEVVGAKKVLTAAALTYVAAAFIAVINLVRIILIFSKRGRD